MNKYDSVYLTGKLGLDLKPLLLLDVSRDVVKAFGGLGNLLLVKFDVNNGVGLHCKTLVADRAVWRVRGVDLCIDGICEKEQGTNSEG